MGTAIFVLVLNILWNWTLFFYFLPLWSTFLELTWQEGVMLIENWINHTRRDVFSSNKVWRIISCVVCVLLRLNVLILSSTCINLKWFCISKRRWWNSILALTLNNALKSMVTIFKSFSWVHHTLSLNVWLLLLTLVISPLAIWCL